MGQSRPRTPSADRGAVSRARFLSTFRAVHEVFESPAVSSSPEDSRLAACGPRDVTLYTRPGCHLCDEAKSAIARLFREFAAALRDGTLEAGPLLNKANRCAV